MRRLLGRLSLAFVVFAAAACSLNQAPENQTVAAGPPRVQLNAPQPNATYLEGVAVNIQALVSNAGPDIDRVEVTIDGTIVTTLPQPNPSAAPVFSVAHSWPAQGVGQHTVGVTAFRADGSASEPATQTFNVISSASLLEETAAPTPVPPTQPPPEEGEDDNGDEGNGGEEGGGDDEPAEPEATSTPSAPVATFNQGLNVRRGPGTNFNPPIGSFAAGQTADVLGRNPAGDWYKVRYYNAEGWVFASLVTISGDASNLPVDAGPPTPIPATATPIPPTAVPVTATPPTAANLVAGNIRLNPAQPTCNVTFNISIDIANLGTQNTTATGSFTVEDFWNGQRQAQTQGSIPIIEAGKTIGSAQIPLTVNTNHSVEHTIVITLNPNGGIPETGSGDNRREIKYTLQKGAC